MGQARQKQTGYELIPRRFCFGNAGRSAHLFTSIVIHLR